MSHVHADPDKLIRLRGPFGFPYMAISGPTCLTIDSSPDGFNGDVVK